MYPHPPYTNAQAYHIPQSYQTPGMFPPLAYQQQGAQSFLSPRSFSYQQHDPFSRNYSFSVARNKSFNREEEPFDQEGIIYMMQKQRFLLENFAFQLRAQQSNSQSNELIRMRKKLEKLEQNSNDQALTDLTNLRGPDREINIKTRLNTFDVGDENYSEDYYPSYRRQAEYRGEPSHQLKLGSQKSLPRIERPTKLPSISPNLSKVPSNKSIIRTNEKKCTKMRSENDHAGLNLSRNTSNKKKTIFNA